MKHSSIRALMDFTARDFHFRQSLDICVSLIARLQTYATAPTSRADNPIKIRQDLLATNDIVDLALHLRRFAEITHSTARMKNSSLSVMSWPGDGKFQICNVSLYDVVSRVIHSNTCAACRNLTHVFLHFGAGAPAKHLLDSSLGTSPMLVVESEDKEKAFVSLTDFLNMAFKVIDGVAQKDETLKDYLERRKI